MLSRHARDVLMLGIGALIWPGLALGSWIYYRRPVFHQ